MRATQFQTGKQYTSIKSITNNTNTGTTQLQQKRERPKRKADCSQRSKTAVQETLDQRCSSEECRMKEAVVTKVGILVTGAFLFSFSSTDAFVLVPDPTTAAPRFSQLQPWLQSALSMQIDVSQEETFTLSMEEIDPLLRFGSGDSEKVVNAFGLKCLLVSLLTGPIWMAAMMIVHKLSDMNPKWDPHHSIYDATGKVWSKTWLSLTGCIPAVTGHVQQLQEGQTPCLYVANHASWLDIPILCTVLDPVFKFIAKGELSKVPCIGQQLKGVCRNLDLDSSTVDDSAIVEPNYAETCTFLPSFLNL